MQIIPRIDIQIYNEQDEILPGDKLEGDILITSDSAVVLNRASLDLVGKISYSKEQIIERRSNHLESDVKQKSNCNSKASQIVKGGAPQRRNSRYNEWEPETYEVSHVLIKSDGVIVGPLPNEARPGITQIRFIVWVPKVCNGEELLPTMSAKQGLKEINVSYALSAKVMVSSSLLIRAIAVPIHSYKNFTVVTPPDRFSQLKFHETVDKNSTARVKFWTKSSLGIKPLIRYYVGFDTSESWCDVTLKMSGPSAVSVAEPYYLQESVRLKCFISERSNPDSNDTSVKVKSVSITLVTHVRNGFNYYEDTVFYTQALKPQEYSFDMVLNHKETDITALISGAKLPTTVLPTTSTMKLKITHNLQITVEFQSVSQDGTSQVPSTSTLDIPIFITNKSMRL